MLLYELCLNGPGLTSYQIVSFSRAAVPPVMASRTLIVEAPVVRGRARLDAPGCAGLAQPAGADRSSGAAARRAPRSGRSDAARRSGPAPTRWGAPRSRPALRAGDAR